MGRRGRDRNKNNNNNKGNAKVVPVLPKPHHGTLHGHGPGHPWKKTPFKSLTTILELPQTVYFRIVDSLSPKDCLSLRRACKTTNQWVAERGLGPQQCKKWQYFQMAITGEGICTFATAVKMSLPITSFQIRNSLSKLSIYESNGYAQFRKRYGSIVTSFHVEQLFMFEPEEAEFFNEFPNLEDLQVQRLMTCLPKRKGVGDKEEKLLSKSKWSLSSKTSTPITTSLRRLTIEEMGTPANNKDQSSMDIGRQWVLNLISSCGNLQYLYTPSIRKSANPGCVPPKVWNLFVGSQFDNSYCNLWLRDLELFLLRNYLVEDDGRMEEFTLDFGAFINEVYFNKSSDDFLEVYIRILQQAYDSGVHLNNVFTPALQWVYNTRLHEGWPLEELQLSLKFLDNVVSLIDISPILTLGFSDLDSLKKITVVCDLKLLKSRFFFQEFLHLNHLNIVDATVIIQKGSLTEVTADTWKKIGKILFGHWSRVSVRQLSLCVKTHSDIEEKDKVIRFHKTVFDVDLITQNLKYVRTLTICGWNPSSEIFNKLLIGLPHLQELCIDSCKKLDNFGLIHQSKKVADILVSRRTGFLTIHGSWCLKKLVLKNLDQMVGITSDFFVYIVSKTRIKELYISGVQPLPQMTRRVLIALLEGEFGQNVERFPFHTWKSMYLSEDEKNEIGKRFRSIV